MSDVWLQADGCELIIDSPDGTLIQGDLDQLGADPPHELIRWIRREHVLEDGTVLPEARLRLVIEELG